ncbi:exonuclease V a 5' deoxyribonuclease-domain-containing protein [Phellopilus nigrolimitatus]|nr:exonuclease V a 5' deoxyribonuclease-domain-containing protein [Phellopilus nigrolimitatus]
MSDEDLFDDLSWPVFTENDFLHIDRICEEAAVRTNKGAPRVAIDVEVCTNGHNKDGGELELERDSPYDRFRKRGYLSVTDVVSPSWCVLVQFEYGLYQRRNKPVASRPKSFVTEKGKEIRVKTDVAVKNDRILTKGRNLHKVLEREIHKEEVIIKVQSPEESWALRMLDVLSRLKTLKETHVCREVPVWGIVHDDAIVGIIDELHLVQKNPETKPKSQRSPSRKHSSRKSSIEKSQAKLDSFVIPDEKSAHSSTAMSVPYDILKPPTHVLHILDNKSRKTQGIPTHADTLPSRLQLMLYRRLLEQTITLNPEVFGKFCTRLNLDPKREFSEAFQAEMTHVILENQLSRHFLDATCLGELGFPYKETLREMDIAREISTTLSLVYRWRGSPTQARKTNAHSGESTPSGNGSNMCTPKCESGPAPSTNFKDAAEISDTVEVEIDAKLSPSLNASVEVTEPADAEESILSESPMTRKRKRRTPWTSSTSVDVSSGDETLAKDEREVEGLTVMQPLPSNIIGTKKFQYNAPFLDAYMGRILHWWHGQRAPVGVDIENTGRCNSCEYKNGCEWREQKAQEFLAAKSDAY